MPNYSSLYLGSQASYQITEKKHKCSLLLSNVSFSTHDLQIRCCPRDPPLRPLAVENGVWVTGGEKGGRRGGALLVPPSTCLASRWNGLPQAIRAGRYTSLVLPVSLSPSPPFSVLRQAGQGLCCGSCFLSYTAESSHHLIPKEAPCQEENITSKT